jgi:DNA-directed RNA polymerase subunit RPC12/RpoP
MEKQVKKYPGQKVGTCTICGKAFIYYPSGLSGLYCSRSCSGKVMVKNLGTRMLGKKWSDETRKRFTAATTGEKHWHWAGKKIGYTALHRWVERHRGKPRFCEHCGTTEAKIFEWCNKSQEYRRDLSDFIRLCRQCHRDMDRIDSKSGFYKFLHNGKNEIHLAKIRELTKAWHASPEGREWHRQHAIKMQFDKVRNNAQKRKASTKV